jgi:hypothetical protein
MPFGLRRLLGQRICDLVERLELSTEAPWIQRPLAGVFEDLHDAGLRHLRPDVYLGDEWFSPGGVPAISIPFYLAHPDLREIEMIMAGAIEGGTPASIRKLIRHEAGHCFDHAYKIARDFRWRKIFGNSSRIYLPEVYLPDARSLEHVTHLPGFYAQSHPDEDFAETFAVSITPGMDWQYRYHDRPQILRKLRFVQALIRRHGRQKPRETAILRTCDARRMRMTLGRYYQLRMLREARWERLQSKLLEA